ncbi:HISTONE-LIKE TRANSCRIPTION FACTOR CCAAT-RELATED [Salix viminalis]|uniref:HISTONE-LIKE TRANSCRIPTION FACTOR CCAAT-RELATED n=1 Tax=Salix viminalis TaxID=40686 RepID=A0A9Q0SB16_SALVM|nr:HISTONE-LIKE TRANSCRIPTION FACTOR CCAAT-RELATED [Salix viminalis]
MRLPRQVAVVVEEAREEDSPNLGMLDEDYEPGDLKDNIPAARSLQTLVHVFDLNLDLDKNGETKTALASIPASSSTKSGTVVPANSSTKPIPELKHQEVPEWSLADIEKMGIDPILPANLNTRIDEEDYDEKD